MRRFINRAQPLIRSATPLTTNLSSGRRGTPIALVAIFCLALAVAICIVRIEFFNSTALDTAKRKSAFPGFTAETASEGGLIITSVKGDSSAERAGLVSGDHITQFNYQPISSLSQAERLVQHGSDHRLEIGLVHHQRRRTIILTAF